MSTFVRASLIAVIFLVIFVALSFLPVIPVLKGAVVPPSLQRYSLGFVSIQDLFGIVAFMRVGVSYQVRWYTLVGIAGLFAVSCLITTLVVVRLLPKRR
jgi:hypothetical protein